MRVQQPPQFEIEEFKISKDNATQKAKEARQKLFETEKGKTYLAIDTTANKGGFYLEYKYPENCNSENILALKDELLKEGYKVKYNSDPWGDVLEISWYPES